MLVLLHCYTALTAAGDGIFYPGISGEKEYADYYAAQGNLKNAENQGRRFSLFDSLIFQVFVNQQVVKQYPHESEKEKACKENAERAEARKSGAADQAISAVAFQ